MYQEVWNRNKFNLTKYAPSQGVIGYMQGQVYSPMTHQKPEWSK